MRRVNSCSPGASQAVKTGGRGEHNKNGASLPVAGGSSSPGLVFSTVRHLSGSSGHPGRR